MTQNKPKIRFQGFSDAWELRKFSDLVVRLNKASNNNQLPKVEFEDIIAGEGRLNKDISHKFDDRKGILFEPQNILYGKLRPYLKNWLIADFKGVALGDFWVFKVIKSEPKFIYSLIQANNYQRVANDTSGTKMPRSDWKKVSSSYFSIPQSTEEQEKIGNLFKQLDNTITLHQRKLDKLKRLKQGYLQRLFPQNGEKVPRLRFTNFIDEWKQHKLSEIATMNARIGWQNLRTSEFLDSGDYMLITGTDFKDGKIDYSSIHYVEKERYDQDKKIQIKNDSILITKDGTLGKVAYIEGLNMPATLNAGVFNVRVKENDLAVSQYLFHYLKAPFLLKYAAEQSTGGTIKHLNQNVLVDFPIPLPIKQEQHKLGQFFKQLDDTITLHQSKLAKLKSIKQAFLQKMFI